MTDDVALDVRGLQKTFGDVRAIDDLDLTVATAQVHGLVGPNGAGKTTLLRILFGLVAPDAGVVTLLGQVADDAETPSTQGIGGFVEEPRFYPYLTARRNLELMADLDGGGQDRIDEVLENVRLDDRADRKVGGFSSGMRQRLGLAASLLRKPRLLLLDEPTVGLDPQVRQELWALIDSLRSQGVSILMSTHYIEEAQRLCDTDTIMSHGNAVAVGPPQALIREHAGSEAVEVYGSPARLSEVEHEARERGWRTRRTGTSIAVLHSNGNGAPEGDRRVTNLEDVFVLLTGEEIE
jgi:lipooligosaccharide transport system ATP-binding protein